MKAIYQNSTLLLKGDDTSVRVVFRNLTGRNFTGERYRQYLTVMSNDLGIEIVPELLRMTDAAPGIE